MTDTLETSLDTAFAAAVRLVSLLDEAGHEAVADGQHATAAALAEAFDRAEAVVDRLRRTGAGPEPLDPEAAF